MGKTLKAVFQDGKDTVRVRGLWQYDTGVQLEVEGIPAGDVNRVDFGTSWGEETIPVVVSQDGNGVFSVRIPAKATEFPGEVTAYIYLAAADYGHTVKSVAMPMLDRPASGTSIPEESTDPFGEAIEKVAGYTEKAKEYAEAAAEETEKILGKSEEIEKLKKDIEELKKNGTGTGSGDGLTQTEKNYILALFEASAYTNSQVSATYKALKAIWDGSTTVIPVQSISLSNEKMELTKGDIATVTVTIVPTNATNQIVSWSVSPEGYATITNGTITAVTSGTCTVTATVDGKTASCVVTISEPQTIPGETPVYELPAAKQFLPANKEYIDTGAKLFEDISAQPSWTILIDANDFGRLKNLTTSPVMFHCGALEDDGFLSVMAWTNGAIVFDLYGVQNRIGWWGGSTTARLYAYLQIKGTQYRMGTDPENDEWKDITNYSKNINASLLLLSLIHI